MKRVSRMRIGSQHSNSRGSSATLYPPAWSTCVSSMPTFLPGAGHRPGSGQADSVHRRPADVCPDSGRFRHARHCPHRPQLHHGQTCGAWLDRCPRWRPCRLYSRIAIKRSGWLATPPARRSKKRSAPWPVRSIPTSPKTSPKADDKFSVVNEANEVLRDPDKRRKMAPRAQT